MLEQAAEETPCLAMPAPAETNPDWALLVERDGTERLYFVVETKTSLFDENLRGKEAAKMKCGKAHFEALAIGESPAEYVGARDIDDLIASY